MRSFAKMISDIVRSLNRFEVDYAITGALAVSYYGAPRTTIDFDILAYASSDNIQRLLKALERSHIEAEEKPFRDAAKAGAFSIVRCKDKASPHTVDIILRRRRFQKITGRALGLRAPYQSPEELIRMKLRMIKATKPPERAVKDFDDVHSILKSRKLNLARIKKYAKVDKTSQIIDSILETAE